VPTTLRALGTARWDFFYSAQDRFPFVTTQASTTTAGSSFVLKAKDQTLQVTSSTGFRAGELVRLQGSGYEVYLTVVKVTDSTHLVVRPLDTRTTVAGLTQPFPYGNSISSGASIFNAFHSGEFIVPQSAHSLIVDLTEAPSDGSYTYLVLAAATVYGDTAAKTFRVQVRGFTEELDPILTFSASAAYHQAIFTQRVAGAETGDRYPYNSAFLATFPVGNRWHVQLQVLPLDSGQTVTMENMRLIAIRVDTSNAKFASAGSGGVGLNTQTTTSGSYQDGVSVTVPTGVGTNDTNLIVACATVGNTDADAADRNTDARLNIDGTMMSDVRIYGEEAADLYTIAYIGVRDGLSASDVIKWQFAANLGTALISQQFIAFVTLAAIPGLEELHEQNGITVTSGTTPDYNQAAGQSQQSGLDDGLHIALVHFAGGNNTTGQSGYVRVEYDSDPTWIYEGNRTPRGYAGRQKARSGAPLACFWFHRAEVSGGALSAGLGVRLPIGGSGSMTDTESEFSVLRERAKFPVAPNERTTLAAELESGAVLKRWVPLGSNQFRKDLPDVGLVTAVHANAVVYAEVADVGSLDVQTWFWDPSARQLTIEMAASEAPDDDDQTVLVRWLLLFARDAIGLTDDDAEDRPYEPRLNRVPQFRQQLQMREGTLEVVSTIGDLEIAAGDGDLDHTISQELIPGARVTVLRGYAAHSVERKDYDVIALASATEPRLDRDALTVRLFGTHVELKRPIATTRATVYEAGLTRDDQTKPHIWGAAFRVPCYRITDVTTNAGTNSYMIAGHALHDILALYEDPDDPRTAITTYTKDLTNGEVDVVNQNLPAWAKLLAETPPAPAPAHAPDVIYANVVGYAETIAGASVPIATPGRIGLDLLQNHAGVASTEVDAWAFRMLDMKWRRRMDQSDSPYVQLFRAPTVGLYIAGAETIEDALISVATSAFFYLKEQRSGRLTCGVPEISAQNALENSGFERDSSEPWPWFASTGGTFATTTTKVFEGARAAQFNNGSRGALHQCVLLQRSGQWVLSALVCLEEGNGSAFRLGVIPPGDGWNYIYSDPFKIESARWKRFNLLVDLQAGETGSATASLIPFAPEVSMPEVAVPTSGLTLWLKADSIIADGDATVDGGLLAQWTDKSGAGKHMLQATTANKPTFRMSARFGHPVVVFDVTNDAMACGSALALTRPYTIMVACTFTDFAKALGTTSIFRNILRDSGDQFILGLRGAKYGVHNGTSDTLSIDGAENDRWVVLCATVETSLTTLYLNGVSQGTHAAGANVTDLQMSRNDADGCAGAQVGEVLVWSRLLSADEIATVSDYLMLKWGIATASINVDNAWLVPVGASIEPILGEDDQPALNFVAEESSVAPDVFYEAEIPYNPFVSGSVPTPTRVMTDQEARQLVSTYDPTVSQARAAISTARRIRLESALVTNSGATDARESSAGVAAHVVLNFSRMANLLAGKLQGITRMPSVGELFYHPPTLHIPAAASAFPFWLITSVEDTDIATEVALGLQREIDPVRDRVEVTPGTFPLGAMGVSLIATAIAGWDEETQMRGRYCRVTTDDPTYEVQGSVVHTHTLSHTHAVGSHTHTWSVSSIGAIEAYHVEDDGTQCEDGMVWTAPYAGSPMLDLARAREEGGHGHTAPAGTYTTSGTAPTSSAPNAAISTGPGSNEVKNKRVMWRRRTGGSDEIPTSIMLGYLGSAAPTGWSRETGLDGFYLKGATLAAGTATSLTTNWFAADNTVMAVASVANINVGTRLLVFNGSQLTHVIVQSISGLNLTVRLLNEVGNTNGITYFSVGPPATAISPQNETAGQSYTPSSHDHDTTVPSHQHTALHTHTDSNTTSESGAADASESFQCHDGTYPERCASWDEHTHHVDDVSLQSDPSNSGSASGSAVSGAANVLDVFELMFIKPSGAGVTQIPAGAVAFWENDTPPSGWSVVGDADGLFVKGAESGLPPAGGMVKTHAHTFTAASHTYSHSHSPASGLRTSCDNLQVYVPDYPFVGPFVFDHYIASAGIFGLSRRLGHSHAVTLSAVSTTAASLASASGVASSVAVDSARRPLHCRLVLIRKD